MDPTNDNSGNTEERTLNESAAVSITDSTNSSIGRESNTGENGNRDVFSQWKQIGLVLFIVIVVLTVLILVSLYAPCNQSKNRNLFRKKGIDLLVQDKASCVPCGSEDQQSDYANPAGNKDIENKESGKSEERIRDGRTGGSNEEMHRNFVDDEKLGDVISCCVLRQEIISQILNHLKPQLFDGGRPHLLPLPWNISFQIVLKKPSVPLLEENPLDSEFINVTSWAYVTPTNDKLFEINLERGFFKVKRAGKYLITSSLSFVSPVPPVRENVAVWFAQKIMVDVPEHPLLQNSQVKSCSAINARENCYTSNIFAPVYLKEETVLSIKVKQMHLLTDAYFSILLLQ